MLGVKSFDPCREFGCFQSLFFIVVDHCVPFTLAVVKSQVVLRSPFVERFHCILYKVPCCVALTRGQLIVLFVYCLFNSWKPCYVKFLYYHQHFNVHCSMINRHQ